MRSVYQTKNLFLILLLFSALIPQTVTGADIYSYTDSNGNMYFTDTPTSAKYIQVYPGYPTRHAVSYSSSRYDRLIREASETNGIRFELIKAIIQVESSFNPNAVSKAGALGLMQIMPLHFEALQINDPFDPWDNIMGGTYFFKQLLDRFDGDVSLSLAAYNAGSAAVERHGGIPPYRETQHYVKKVLTCYYDLNNRRQSH